MNQTQLKCTKLDKTKLNGLKWTKVDGTGLQCFVDVAQYIGV